MHFIFLIIFDYISIAHNCFCSSVHTLLPYDYYSLNFCKPADGVKPYSENLGEFLRGDRIENSAYAISMLEDKYCKVLCQTEFSDQDVTAFTAAIARQYHHNWIIDNLPAASILDTDQFVTTQYVGFPIGYTDGPTSFLYNHVNIILEYHEVEGEGYRCGRFSLSLCAARKTPLQLDTCTSVHYSSLNLSLPISTCCCCFCCCLLLAATTPVL